MCPSQNYAAIPAQATCEVQHAQMAPRMGTRLARTVADHALHVRLLVLKLFVGSKLQDLGACEICRLSIPTFSRFATGKSSLT